MSLTEIKVKNAKAPKKTCRLYDDRGLYLEVTPSGNRWWRLKYRYNDKEKRLALGVYPDVSLKRAREKRDDARRLLADGVDPSQYRKDAKLNRENQLKNTFRLIATEWHQNESGKWTPDHAKEVMRRLTNDLFPYLGDKPITEISAPVLLFALKKTEGRGARETTRRLLQYSGKVFRYAKYTGRATNDPSYKLNEALQPVQQRHFPSITNPDGVAQLLRAIDGYEGHIITKYALQLAPLVFVRPGELRTAEWAEFDLGKHEWNIPGEKMKMGEPHLVPISSQVMKILEELKPLTGDGKYLFPSLRTKLRPLSDGTLNAALRRLGYNTTEEMCVHGFRAMARTILDEILCIRPDYIEHQLAHAVKDPNGTAYNRTKHLGERKNMMQVWADYLDGLRMGGAKVIPITRQAVANSGATT